MFKEKFRNIIKLLFVVAVFCPIFVLFAIAAGNNVTVNTTQELQQAFNDNNDITIGSDFTIDSMVNIPSSYQGTITGGGHTLLMGVGFPEMFVINGGANVRFENLNLNANASGKILNIGPGSTITYDGGSLSNARSWVSTSVGASGNSEGGAVYLGTGATLNINNVAFNDNVGVQPNPVPRAGMSGHGGAIYAYRATLNITNSTFNRNTSGDGYSCGGAIYVEECTTNVSGTTFAGNHVFATRSDGGQQGGAIYANRGSFTSDRNIYNIARTFNTGGAIYLYNITANISNDEYKADNLGDAYGISGGAICTSNSNTTITSSKFSASGNSKVIHAGGLIDVVGTGNFKLIGSTLTGAGSWWNGPSIASFGGAIAFETGSSATALIENTTIRDVTTDENGGAISISTRQNEASSVNLTIRNSNIINTRTRFAWKDTVGGGIFVGPGNTVNIEGGNITDNFAVRGGGIYNQGNVTISGGNAMRNNTAYQIGGGVYNDAYLKVDNSGFTGNRNAEGRTYPGKNEHPGGNIYANKDVIITPSARFDDNDVRVLDRQSAIILTGTLNNKINVSISENPIGNTNDTYYEAPRRYIGYTVAKGDGSYSPNITDAKMLHYVSRDTSQPSSSFGDHESIGKWDYLHNPVENTVVLGQRARMTYHSNASNATFADSTNEKSQLYYIYSSNTPWSYPAQMTRISDEPIRATYRFLNWYTDASNGKPDIEDNRSLPLFDFSNERFTSATSPITEILTRNDLHTYAVYEKTVEVRVRKVWSRQDKKEASVTVALFKDGADTNKTVVLDESNNWQGKFTELDYKNNGNNIVYTVKEVGTNGRLSSGDIELNGHTYTLAIGADSDTDEQIFDYTLTNTYKIPKIDISVRKNWVGTTRYRQQVRVQLLKNGQQEGTPLVLDENNNWRTSFTELDTEDEYGTDINYDVREVGESNGKITLGTHEFNVEKTGNARDGYVITNTYIVPKTKVLAVKSWDRADKKAASTRVKLLKNGVDINRELELNEANSFRAEFAELDVSENDTDIAYTVKEVSDDNSLVGDGQIVTIGDNSYRLAITSQNIQDGISYSLTNNYIIPKIDIPVTKVWKKADGSIMPQNEIPQTVEVALEVSGRELNNRISLSASGLSSSFRNIDKEDSQGADIVYSVKEIGENNSVLIIGQNKYDVTYSGNQTDGFVIINQLRVPDKEIRVTKVWQDALGNTLPQNSIPEQELTMKVFADGIELADKQVVLTKNNLSGSLLVPITQPDGRAINYTFKEVGEDNSSITIEDKEYHVSYSVDNRNTDSFIVTNKYIIPKTELNITKSWKNADDTEMVNKPDVEVIAHIYKNGQKLEGRDIILNSSNNWQNRVSQLDKTDEVGNDIQYSVKEYSVGGELVGIDNIVRVNGKKYISDIDGFNIINKFQVDTESIRVNKLWKNADSSDMSNEQIPDAQIGVELYADGRLKARATLTKASSYTTEFINMPLTDSYGNTINYSVKETGVDEADNSINIEGRKYQVFIDGLNITNKLIVQSADISVSKIWKKTLADRSVVDMEEREIPQSITAQLIADDVVKAELVLNAAKGWSGTFENIALTDVRGEEINYTVKEAGENNNDIRIENKWYKVSVEEAEQREYIITNTKSFDWIPLEPSTRDITVTKLWKDYENNDIEAPIDSINIKLLKNGIDTGKRLILDRTNNFTDSFRALPAQELGISIEYTVEEENAVDNHIILDNLKYYVSVDGNMADGFTVTNTKLMPSIPLIPGARRNIRVYKVWEDASGAALEEQNIPQEITVEVFKENEPDVLTDSIVLNEGNSWDHVFNLPNTNADGSAIRYLVREAGAEDGKIAIDGKEYVSEISRVADGYRLKNIYIEPERRISINIEKRWQNAVSTPVEIALMKGSVILETVQLDSTNDWKHTFEELPAFENGDKINYSVIEMGEEGELKDGWLDKFINGLWYKMKIEEYDNTFVIINATPSEASPSDPDEPVLPDGPIEPNISTPSIPSHRGGRTPRGGHTPKPPTNIEVVPTAIDTVQVEGKIVEVKPPILSRIPKTFDNMNVLPAIFTMLLSLTAMIILVFKRKRLEQ